MSDLYLECSTGISGDMAVAALIDAGADTKALKTALNSICVKGFKAEIRRVIKNGIDCADFNVILDEEHENNDHDMEYLFGERYESNVNEEPSEHHHHNEHGSSHPHHEHRNLSEIIEIIKNTKMTENAKNLACKIFNIIAEAESKAHSLPVDEVHFHEVGAVDSIVDVIAFSVCFDSLNVKRVFIPYLCEGTGSVRCQHGVLPVPVPAVVNIAGAYSIPLKITQNKGELVTPTGIAIASAIVTDKNLPETLVIKKTGMGAGKRAYEKPSILRAYIIEENRKKDEREDFSDIVLKIETNIDDCTGEALGFTMNALLKAGALDVYYIPCFMKKNRPAYILNVLCRSEDSKKLEEIIFADTTTIGLRKTIVERDVLKRSEVEIETPYGKIHAKKAEGFNVSRILPEYEDVAKIAGETKKSFERIYAELSALCK